VTIENYGTLMLITNGSSMQCIINIKIAADRI